MHNSTLCYITRGNDVLMLHRVKKKNDINKDKWIGIGGKFEFGESLENCVIRIKEGNNDVTSSVEAAYAENPVVYSLTLRDENGSQLIEADEVVKATADYEVQVPAVIQCGNIYACQFHPEKSGEKGMMILRNFCED